MTFGLTSKFSSQSATAQVAAATAARPSTSQIRVMSARSGSLHTVLRALEAELEAGFPFQNYTRRCFSWKFDNSLNFSVSVFCHSHRMLVKGQHFNIPGISLLQFWQFNRQNNYFLLKLFTGTNRKKSETLTPSWWVWSTSSTRARTSGLLTTQGKLQVPSCALSNLDNFSSRVHLLILMGGTNTGVKAKQ